MPAKKEILRNEALKEIYRSSRNPVYFIDNFCKIRHPTRGLIPFKLYDYQKEALENFLAYDRNIINKARQLGFSTLLAAFIVWLILFHKDKEVLVMATKADVAKNLIKKVKLMLKHVPDWMYLADITTNQAHSIGLSNGSSVKSIARGDDAGRSEALALLVVDEAAHIRDMGELWKGLASTVSTGGKVIALSTPKGVGNWFYQYCKEAKSGENGWHYQEVFWWSNPDYAEGLEDDPSIPGGKTSPWFKITTAGWTKQQIAQELLTSFTETGDTFLDPATIAHYEEISSEPLIKKGPDNGLWIWKEGERNKSYLIATDSSSGTSDDYSTAIVLDPRELDVCAEYKGKLPPDEFGAWLVNDLAPMYNNPLIVPENNNIGMVTAYTIRNMGYDHLAYIDEKTGRLVDKWTAQYLKLQPGFRTDSKTRPIILQKAEELLRKFLVNSHSKRMVNEFLSFVWKNGKPQARKGANDDLVMALAVALWIRESYFAYESNATQDALAMYGAVAISKKEQDKRFPGTNNRVENEKRKISQMVKNQSTLRVGSRVINIDWIHKM